MSRITLVTSGYYPEILDGLLEGAVPLLEAAGHRTDQVEVPGSFEIPAAIALLDEQTDPAKRAIGYLALGCVIRGETSHYDHVCEGCVQGLQALAVRSPPVLIGFGVLTVDHRDQAMMRIQADGKHAGRSASEALLSLLALKGTVGIKGRDRLR